MWTLIQIELFKIFRRPRTYIAFAAITGLIGIIQFGLKLDGDAYIDFMMRDITSSITVEGKILNGYQVCYIVLQILLVHVPLLIALVAADMISGEANMGTLRIMLTKPISRTRFLLAKFMATVAYTLLLLVWLAVLALFVNMLLFGTDDLFLLKSQYVVLLKKDDIFWRYVWAFGFAALAMITVASLGFLFSFFDIKVNDANEAIVGSIQNPQKIINSALVLVLHIIGFVTTSILIFRKKDVLS